MPRRDSNKTGSDPSKKKEECPCCSKTVEDKDMALQCEICNEWTHIKCIGISETEYKFVKEHQTIHWFCEQCNKSIASVIKTVTLINQNQEKLEKNVSDLKEECQKRMTAVENDMKALSGKTQEIDTKMETAIEAKLVDSFAKPTFASIVANEVDNKFSKVSVDVLKVQTALDDAKKNVQEDKDRESRANNIILYRVPEGNSKDETNKNDKAFCMELCKEVLSVDDDEIDFKAIFRLGKAETGKVRPILLQLREKSVKNQIMESLYKLKRADDKFKNISVTHDLTQKERDECKELVEEAKKRQAAESGEFIWRVRGLPGQLKLTKIKLH